MRLGVISRATIVFSCFWMAGATQYFATNIAHEANEKADAFYRDCNAHPAAAYDCGAARDRIYLAQTADLQFGLWGFAAAEAAIILAFGLIVLTILYGSIRWIAAGRQPRAK